MLLTELTGEVVFESHLIDRSIDERHTIDDRYTNVGLIVDNGCISATRHIDSC